MDPGIVKALVVVVALAGCRRGANSAVPTVEGAPDAAAPVPATAVDASAVPAPAPAPAPDEGFTPATIVVDERAAYWFSNAHDLVMQKPSGDGAPAIVARTDGQPVALALDARRVHWVENDALVAVERADGTKKVVAKLTRPRGLVLDGASAFVVADEGENASAVFRVDLEGGASQKLASVPPSTMTLAADESSIFVVTSEVLRIPKKGGAPAKVSASPEEAQAIVLVRDDIVFIGVDPQATVGRVWKMPKRGPARKPAPNTTVMYAGAVPLSGEGGSVDALATDGRRPFWVKEGVLQMPSGKDEPTELGKVTAGTGITVFRSRIYWTSPDGVRSMALPR